MKQIPPSASAERHYRHGLFTCRALMASDRGSMARELKLALDSLLATERSQFDAVNVVYEMRAQLGLTVGHGMDLASTLKLRLGSQSVHAKRQPPYTQIFPKTELYYRLSPEETVQALELLASRVTDVLAEDHPERATAAVLLDAASAIKRDLAVVASKVQEEVRATERCQTAKAELRQKMLVVYGQLLGEVGKGGAERFFLVEREPKKAKPA